MTIRALPCEEWGRLADTPVPQMAPFVPAEDASVLVVEEGSKIVGCLTVLRATYVEGLWVLPEHQNAGVMRGLMRKAVEVAEGFGSQWVFAGAETAERGEFLMRVGGEYLPIMTFVVPTRRGVCPQQ